MAVSPIVTMRLPADLLARLDERADGRGRSETVRAILGEALGVDDVQPENTRLRAAKRAEIVERGRAGERAASIARDVEANPETVRQVLVKAGVPLRGPGTPPVCDHPKDQLKTLPYATICGACGRKIR